MGLVWCVPLTVIICGVLHISHSCFIEWGVLDLSIAYWDTASCTKSNVTIGDPSAAAY